MRRKLSWVALIFSVSALLLTMSPHRVICESDKAVADRLYAQGIRTFDENKNEEGVKKAMAKWEEALMIYEKLGDISHSAGTLLMLGGASHALGEYEEALRDDMRALELYRSLQPPLKQEEAAALANIGAAHHALGDLDQALKFQLESLGMREELHDDAGIASSLSNIGNVYRETGGLEESVRAHERALELHRKTGNTDGEAGDLNNLGNVYFVIGDTGKALKYYAESLKVRGENNSGTLGVANTANNLGVLYQSIGDNELALVYYERSLRIGRSLGYVRGQANVLGNMAVLYHAAGRDKEAAQSYAEALDICRKTKDQPCESNILGGMGLLDASRGDFDAAIPKLERALDISISLGIPSAMWQWQSGLGNAHHGKKNYDKARDYYRDAIETIEGQRSQLNTDDFSVLFMQNKLAVYEEMIHLLLEMGRPEEAYEYLELMKGMRLRIMLERGKVNLFERAPAALRTEAEQLSAKLNALTTQITVSFNREQSTMRNLRIKMLKDECSRTAADYDAVLEKIALENPDVGLLTIGKAAFSLKDAQGLLPDGKTAILEYLAGAEGVVLFFVGKNSFKAIELTDAFQKTEGGDAGGKLTGPALDSQVRDFVGTLDISASINKSSVGLGRHLGTGRKLFAELIDSAAEFIHDGDKLLIVPDGALNFLPFEALITGVRDDAKNAASSTKVLYSKYASVHYLIQDHAIYYAPSSVTALSVLKGRGIPKLTADRSASRKLSGPLVAFGDPYLASTGSAGPRDGAAYAAWDGILKDGLMPLAAAKQEVEDVKSYFRESEAVIGAGALEEVAKKEMKTGNAIHFATHGILNTDDPMSSGLAMSEIGLRLDGKETRDDGLLTAREIFRDPDITLHADLVTLSACSTGKGKLMKGEGIIGLPRAFILAGANNVVVSLWNVDDAGSALLMKLFYANLADGMDKAEALRQAKLAMLKKTSSDTGGASVPGGQAVSYAHPFFWAPFILIGTGD